jgi:hypothetical protein
MHHIISIQYGPLEEVHYFVHMFPSSIPEKIEHFKYIFPIFSLKSRKIDHFKYIFPFFGYKIIPLIRFFFLVK